MLLALAIAIAHGAPSSPPDPHVTDPFLVVDTVQADSSVRTARALDLVGDDQPDLVLATDTGLRWVLSNGATLTSSLVANDLAVVDLDHDGHDDVLSCGADGVGIVTLDGSFTALSPTPCQTIETLDWDGTGPIDLAVADAGLSILVGRSTDAGFPTYDALSIDDIAFVGKPLLAAAQAHLWAASTGDTTLWDLTPVSLDSSTLSSAPGDLRTDGTAPAYTLPAESLLVLTSGATTPLARSPTALLPLDLDGDGVRDWVTVHPKQLSLVIGGAATTMRIVETDPASGRASVADLDHDGCADLLLPRGAALELLHARGCSASADLDLDGVTEAEGDCDDHNPSIAPGMPELCNLKDDDCNGIADDLAPTIALESTTLDEGQSAALLPTIEGCATTLEWSSAGVAAECLAEGATMLCHAKDDGREDIHVDLIDRYGTLVATANAQLTVENLPPEIPVAAGTTLEVLQGATLAWPVPYADPGPRDLLSWTARGGPPGLKIDDGVLRYEATPDDVGQYDLSVTATDDDSAEATASVLLHVSAEKVAHGCATGATGIRSQSPHEPFGIPATVLGWTAGLLFTYGRRKRA